MTSAAGTSTSTLTRKPGSSETVGSIERGTLSRAAQQAPAHRHAEVDREGQAAAEWAGYKPRLRPHHRRRRSATLQQRPVPGGDGALSAALVDSMKSHDGGAIRQESLRAANVTQDKTYQPAHYSSHYRDTSVACGSGHRINTRLAWSCFHQYDQRLCRNRFGDESQGTGALRKLRRDRHASPLNIGVRMWN